MCGDATGYQIKAGIGVRIVFRGVLFRFHMQATLGGCFAHAFEHRCGDISEDHVMPERCQVETGVPGSGCNIEDTRD